MEKCSKNKGFTLAELLIVVAIIGVLVAVSIPIFTSQLEKSKTSVQQKRKRLQLPLILKQREQALVTIMVSLAGLMLDLEILIMKVITISQLGNFKRIS